MPRRSSRDANLRGADSASQDQEKAQGARKKAAGIDLSGGEKLHQNDREIGVATPIYTEQAFPGANGFVSVRRCVAWARFKEKAIGHD